MIATQNPIEHDGTWELPQAQLDRFILHVVVDYPVMQAERDILDLVMLEVLNQEEKNSHSHEDAVISKTTTPQLISKKMLATAQRSVLDVHVSPMIRDYIVRLIAGTRDDPEPIAGVGEHLSHPVSPRGSISLARTAQALAWLEGRDHVLPEDVSALAADVLRHRMGLNYRADADGVRSDDIITILLDRISVV